MKQQPGFISTQLHRCIGGSTVFVNYAVWESVEYFKRAFTNPEFQAKMKDYSPSAAASPRLIKKVAVPGICVDKVSAVRPTDWVGVRMSGGPGSLATNDRGGLLGSW